MFKRSSSLHLPAALLAAISICLIGTPCPAADVPSGIQDSQPIWSPNGKMIAFVSTRIGAAGTPAGGKNIWIVDADGGNLRQLTFAGMNELPTWSPDGTKIAFQSGGQLWVVEVATGQFAQLTTGEKAWFAPDWNPKDANKIVCAFQTFVREDNDLAVLNPQTCLTRPSGRQNLRAREGSDDRPRWSRDGKQIAFIGEAIDRNTRQSKWYLMVLRPDGASLKTYCELPKLASRPSWLLDGTSVVVDGGKVCNLTTGKLTSLFPESMKDPDISPDGRRVAYCEEVKGLGQFIFVRKIDGTEKKRVTSQ